MPDELGTNRDRAPWIRTRTQFHRTRFRRAQFHRTRFRRAQFRRAQFRRSQFRSVRFHRTQFPSARFHRARQVVLGDRERRGGRAATEGVGPGGAAGDPVAPPVTHDHREIERGRTQVVHQQRRDIRCGIDVLVRPIERRRCRDRLGHQRDLAQSRPPEFAPQRGEVSLAVNRRVCQHGVLGHRTVGGHRRAEDPDDQLFGRGLLRQPTGDGQIGETENPAVMGGGPVSPDHRIAAADRHADGIARTEGHSPSDHHRSPISLGRQRPGTSLPDPKK
ncbi:pentapeptide repeat-containing protein [Nocardia canadensis]|uniref:pentapeptide repeat-containing protein n=1 Tax=Nocardia canadensis TaxID=3065238 RepID=UPI0037422D2C